MNESILQELNQLMARDETGMNVVLIDTAKRLEELHRVYPGLAKRFECIGTSDSIKAKKAAALYHLSLEKDLWQRLLKLLRRKYSQLQSQWQHQKRLRLQNGGNEGSCNFEGSCAKACSQTSSTAGNEGSCTS